MTLSIAIVGAGIGGLAAGIALRRDGHKVTIYEQASAFSRVGAGIQQGPNSIKVLRAYGLEERLRERAFRPCSSLNRQWDTAEITWERELGDIAEERYGAPYFYMHRGDLHAALADAFSPERVRRSHRLESLETEASRPVLRFDNGEQVSADLVMRDRGSGDGC